jgi:NADH dehydrogenase (ubiquinone) 1 beta subcomplex subunit 8
MFRIIVRNKGSLESNFKLGRSIIYNRALFTRLTGEERQIGEYPEVPWISAQKRDPRDTYSDQPERRNFNEPLHEQHEIMGMWIYDVNDYISKEKALLWLLGAFGVIGVVALMVVIWDPEKHRLAVPKELPYAYETKLEFNSKS